MLNELVNKLSPYYPKTTIIGRKFWLFDITKPQSDLFWQEFLRWSSIWKVYDQSC